MRCLRFKLYFFQAIFTSFESITGNATDYKNYTAEYFSNVTSEFSVSDFFKTKFSFLNIL